MLLRIALLTQPLGEVAPRRRLRRLVGRRGAVRCCPVLQRSPADPLARKADLNPRPRDARIRPSTGSITCSATVRPNLAIQARGIASELYPLEACRPLRPCASHGLQKRTAVRSRTSFAASSASAPSALGPRADQSLSAVLPTRSLTLRSSFAPTFPLPARSRGWAKEGA